MTEELFDSLRLYFREQSDSAGLVEIPGDLKAKVRQVLNAYTVLFKQEKDTDKRESLQIDAEALLSAAEDLMQLRLHKILHAVEYAATGGVDQVDGMTAEEKLLYKDCRDRAAEYLQIKVVE
jgi:DNA replication initiation complex subunit (GINS family)